jgi:hypothetical protein
MHHRTSSLAESLRCGRVWLAALGLFIATGCGEPPRARFTPSADQAQAALEAALRSWQDGKPAGKINGCSNPEVFLIDNCRRPEQTLERFTILGEAAGEGPRCFAVRVRVGNPVEEQRLRFVVFGIDPLWVYRYEDYEMMMHWECKEPQSEKKSTVKKNNSEQADVSD